MTVGIDLGTTNSACAFLDEGVVRFVPLDEGQLGMPSAVGSAAAGRLLVGRSAWNQRLRGEGFVALGFKRLIGRRTLVALGREWYSPEELSAKVLGALRDHATRHLGRQVHDAVITVPAHHDHRCRESTREAAYLAGFRRVRLLNEPTAAALAYAQRSTGPERVVVLDFGGGTCDCTCLEYDGRHYAVRSTTGDAGLGGRDIDTALVALIRERLSTAIPPHRWTDPLFLALVADHAERAKIELSSRADVEICLPFTGVRAEEHPTIHLERREFETVIAPMVARVELLLDRAVREASFADEGFETLVLAGGSSRIPSIRSMVAERYPVAIADQMNPEEVVARGAALYADEQMRQTLDVREAIAATIGIETDDGRTIPLVGRNQSLPVVRSRRFVAIDPRSAAVEIHLVQGEDEQAAKNQSLARFELPHPIGNGERPLIEVSVEVDAEGIVTVHARDGQGRAQAQMQTRVRPNGRRLELESNRIAYLHSLVRRITILARSVHDAPLLSEIEEVLEMATGNQGRDAQDAETDAMVAMLEELRAELLAQGLEVRNAPR